MINIPDEINLLKSEKMKIIETLTAKQSLVNQLQNEVGRLQLALSNNDSIVSYLESKKDDNIPT
jgi:hypothetical protein